MVRIETYVGADPILYESGLDKSVKERTLSVGGVGDGLTESQYKKTVVSSGQVIRHTAN